MAVASIESRTAWASWANLVLGIWLIISAFIWPHTPAAQLNTWILGLIIGCVALVSLALPLFRWLNVLAAVWLFFSTFAIRHNTVGTVWNNVIVAIVVFIIAMTAVVRTPADARVRRPVSA